MISFNKNTAILFIIFHRPDTTRKVFLKDILRFGVLRTENLKNPGLYNGKLGMVILFYEYSRYSGDILYEQFADEMMDSLLELPDSLPFRFADGLTGIGWGITYLLREKFIEGDIEEIHKTSTVKKGLILNPFYNEGKILERIWNSCFNLSK